MDQKTLKAAQRGDATAQFRLGYSYATGDGVEQSYEQAAAWYLKAALKGNAQAQNNLASCYYYGRGVEQSYLEAARWYRKAAEQGLESAKKNLDLCRKKLPQDSMSAYSQGLSFRTIDSDTCEVCGIGFCSDSNLKIPPFSPNKKRVVGIGRRAFYQCADLRSVTIPEGVTKIGNSAFYQCRCLSSVNIPTSVRIIDYKAFLGCSSLTSLVVPEGVTTIGYRAFSDCSALKSIALPESLEKVMARAFERCDELDLSVWGPATYLGNPQHPYLFLLRIIDTPAKDRELIHPQIHPDTRIILPGAFDKCEELSTIVIPDRVTAISRYAFHGCEKLSDVTLPASICRIEEGAFRDCEELSDFYYSGDEDRWYEISFGKNWDAGIYSYYEVHYNESF